MTMTNVKYSNKEKYKRQSVVLALYALKCLNDISEYLLNDSPEDYNMSIYKIKDNGMILKTKKEMNEKEFKKLLLSSIKKYCQDNIEKMSSIMDDKYECKFNIDLITSEIIEDKFDISITKKYVYVDLDV